ncbi:thiamine pyrophosphate-binding protein [Acetobacter indonesiensis]
MSNVVRQRNGGQILVSALSANGVDTIYCVPGESYLPVLDALYDAIGIRTIVTRHEGAASNMADAYGKLTGQPGICFVTRGPGATHASNGVHTAHQDSTPMILFIGQVETKFRGREAFQEIDYRQMFGGIAKWVTEVDKIERIPEIISRAFATALSGRPGPVVISLPEDVLFGMAIVADLPVTRIARAAPTREAMCEIRRLLAASVRPLLIVGGTGWSLEACQALRRFVQVNCLPVAASFRRQDLFDNRLPEYVGQVGIGISSTLAERVRNSDLLLVIGSRLSEEVTSGYTLVGLPRPQQVMIHVHPSAEELGHVYQAHLPVHASLREFAAALEEIPPMGNIPWEQWTKEARADYVRHATPPPLSADHKGVDLARVVVWLDELLPENAVITNGAGNYTAWVHRFYRYRQVGTELAPTNGAMGYGLPAAIAAALLDPSRPVVCFAGDGCFMMYPQELATAMQFGAPVVVIVVNNGMLATIRMHQEEKFPGRVSGTSLADPDFIKFAESFGAYGERVTTTDEFPAAFVRAQNAGRPALIELMVDPCQITPQSRIDIL